MTDSDNSRLSSGPPGVLGAPASEVLTLTPAEASLYSSGIRRGHCEALRQLAGQLRTAGEAYRARVAELRLEKATKAQLRELLESALLGYGSFADQLEPTAVEAFKEQQAHLGRFVAGRDQRPAGLADRVAAAARGALGGWRGR